MNRRIFETDYSDFLEEILLELLNRIINKFPKKGFGRNVITLMTGTAFAQALLILSTPILTRIYSPEDFGEYGNFTAFATIITVVICLRYELTIVLPKSSREAKNLAVLSILTATTLSLFLFFIVFLLGNLSEYWVWGLNDYMYLLPITVFLMGVFQVLNYSFTRVKHFNYLAIAQSGRSIFTIGMQLLLGLFLMLGTHGLILSQLVGQLFAVVLLSVIVIKKYRDKSGISLDLSKMKELAVKYKDFPLYSSWNSFINTISHQIPIIIIAYYFSASVAGFYMMGQRLLSLPMGFVSSSISQVFLQKVAFDKTDKKNNKNSYKLWKSLMPFSVLINLSVIFLAPWGFSFFLGPDWIMAGEYARWIAFWTVFQFVASPLSSISYAYNKQKLFLLMQIGLLILRVTALSIGGILGNPLLAIALFSIVSGLFNFTTIGMYIYIESGKREAITATLSNSIIFIVLLLCIIVI